MPARLWKRARAGSSRDTARAYLKGEEARGTVTEDSRRGVREGFVCTSGGTLARILTPKPDEF